MECRSKFPSSDQFKNKSWTKYIHNHPMESPTNTVGCVLCWDLKEMRSGARCSCALGSTEHFNCEFNHQGQVRKCQHSNLWNNIEYRNIWTQNNLSNQPLFHVIIEQRNHRHSSPCAHHIPVFLLSFSILIKTALKLIWVFQHLLKPVYFLHSKQKQLSSSVLLMHSH